MRKVSVISEDKISDWEGDGPPILFTNPMIRKMLRLASAGKDDIFYDLGSGWGQNLIIALTEFKIKKAVGVEKDKVRHARSLEILKKWGIQPDRGNVVRARFEDVLSGKVKGVDPRESTIIFYGLSTYPSILKDIARNLQDNAKLVYYNGGLFPEIMPLRADFPFYVSIAPFKRPNSEYEWLSRIIQKRRSSTEDGKPPGVRELWNELRHDYDVERGYFGDPLRQYQSRLRRSVASRNRIFK